MKSYPVELRERIVGFVGEGGSKVDAARRFKVSRQTVYRYPAAEQGGSLAPKPQGGSPKRFTDKKLLKAVAKKPDATLKGHAEKLGVSHVAVWRRLRQLSVTLKKVLRYIVFYPEIGTSFFTPKGLNQQRMGQRPM
jgi:Transposase and inactivated derivatives